MGAKWFGAAVKRKEDPALLAGKGRFIDDVRLPGTLHAAFVRSAYPHAKIRGVRTEAARSLAGVHLVLAFADLPEPLRRNALPLFVPSPAITELFLPYALASSEAVYAGEPIAVVVADSRYMAEDAAAQVEVVRRLRAWRTTPPPWSPAVRTLHMDTEMRHRSACRSPSGMPMPPSRRRLTSCASASSIHRGGPFFMECRGLVAELRRDDRRYTVYISSQSSHRIKRCLLDLARTQRQPAPRHHARCRRRLRTEGRDLSGIPLRRRLRRAIFGRPVKWIEDRRENFLAPTRSATNFGTSNSPSTRCANSRAARPHRPRQRRILPWGLTVPWIAATTVPGPYIIPSFKIELVAASPT